MARRGLPLTLKVSNIKHNLKRRTGIELNGKKIKKMVEAALETTCTFCNIPLTLDILGVDHREAVSKGGKTDYKNLNFKVCKTCNRIKGNFSEFFFKSLLEFCEKAGEKNEIIKRLKQSTMMYGRYK